MSSTTRAAVGPRASECPGGLSMAGPVLGDLFIFAGDSIILNCQADGTPVPEILWYKDANPVEPSSTVGIFNDGTELRISTIRNEDIGDYTCIARNGEGQVSHTARVIIAGGAVIMVNKCFVSHCIALFQIRILLSTVGGWFELVYCQHFHHPHASRQFQLNRCEP